MPRDFLSENNKTMPEIEELPGRDFLQENITPKESFTESAIRAIPRIKEDVIKSGYQAISNFPEYLKSAQTEIPGAFNQITQHPMNALSQIAAGIPELGHNILNFPRNVSEYASNRLNLVPKEIAEKIPYQKDISKDINQLFGETKEPGEAFLRGLSRNALNILGGVKVASTLNPMNLTAKSIAKDILNTEKEQITKHNKAYNQIWDKAEKTGYNKVPINEKLLSDNLSTIEKYKTPREYQSLEDFIINPSLQNAQKAQSDMGIIHRKLADKSRSGALTSEEVSLFNAAKNAEKHIEESMFKNGKGETNKKLQDEYKKVTNSYRENVVPYKYNPNIQAFKNKEMLPEELVRSLSIGEFMAKKGSSHRTLGLRKKILPLGLLSSAGALGGTLYQNALGNISNKNR